MLINILVAVNGVKLAEMIADGSLKPGTASNPTSLGAWQQSDVFISMIAQNSVATNNQGHSELTIKAESGDTIRWTMTTFDSNEDHTAFLYNGQFNPANITPLSYFKMHTSIWLPQGSDPKGTLTLLHQYVYAAQGTITEAGATIQYTLSFRLIDNNTGNNLGYFSWDPFISVGQ